MIIECENTTQLSEFGKNLVALGKALQKPNTRINDLAVLAMRCGIELRFGLFFPTPDSAVHSSGIETGLNSSQNPL